MNRNKNLAVLVILALLISLGADVNVSAFVYRSAKNVKLNTQTKKKITRKLPAKKKKVKVTTSKKKVVKVKYNKKTRKLTMTAVATGSAIVKARIKGKKRTRLVIYHVKVNAVKQTVTPTATPERTAVPTGGAIDAGPGALKKAKKAFTLQNEYRKKAGVPELEWSPELYDFCIYRIAASGWDEHRNTDHDTVTYFGNFAKKYTVNFAENMYSGGDDAEDGVNAWYKSPAHKYNMLNTELVSGACVNYRGIWIAVYCKRPASFFQGWQDHPIVKVTIRCYDPETQRYLTNAAFKCYEVASKETARERYITYITDENGQESLYLFVGHEYYLRSWHSEENLASTAINITMSADMENIDLQMHKSTSTIGE